MKNTRKKPTVALATMFAAVSLLTPDITYAQKASSRWSIIVNVLNQVNPVKESAIDAAIVGFKWTTRYQNNTNVEVPALNPMSVVKADTFNSENISDRLEAYKTVLEAGNVQRAEYVDTIENYILSRDAAYSNELGITKLHTDFTRAEKWAKSQDDNYLGDAFDGKFSKALLYKPEEIHKVLEAEIKASHNLTERYDIAISQMQQNLSEYDKFAMQLRIYWAQDLVRAESLISEDMKLADDILKDTLDLGNTIQGVRSPEAMRIEAIKNTMITETNVTQAQAADLMAEASRKDNAQARHARMQNLIGLAAAATSFAGAVTPENQATQSKPTQTPAKKPAPKPRPQQGPVIMRPRT